jgi:hypothetical protein
MTHEFMTRKLAKKEHEFLIAVVDLAQKHGLSPADALPLFGHVARMAAMSRHQRHGTPLDEATITALEMVLAGAGAVADRIMLADPATTPERNAH